MNRLLEKQQFPRWISLSLGCMTLIFVYISYKIQGAPATIIMWLSTLLIFLIMIFFLGTTLTIKIDDKGIKIKFPPLQLRYVNFNWSDISSCEVVRYNPIKDYLGWGIRFSSKGKAYSVKGNQGIQLKLKNGKRILIGTQKGDEVRIVIQNYFSK